MIISLDEAKLYLRIDSDFEDELIENLIKMAQKICADVARLDEDDFETSGEVAKVATLYALAYLYSNREDADYKALTLMLRAILFSIREEA